MRDFPVARSLLLLERHASWWEAKVWNTVDSCAKGLLLLGLHASLELLNGLFNGEDRLVEFLLLGFDSLLDVVVEDAELLVEVGVVRGTVGHHLHEKVVDVSESFGIGF